LSQLVDIQHLPEVQAAIKRMGNGIQPALRTVSGQARRLLIDALSQYPAERPGQKYVRTEALRRGWQRASPLDQGRGFQLVNAVRYAGDVQGDNQGWAFAGRWTPASQIAHDHEEEVLALYEGAIQELTT
jgi:hypothetical protein